MIDVKNIPVRKCLEYIQKPCFPRLFFKLLDSSSDILTTNPRSMGIDLTVEVSKDKMQDSLNVKKFKELIVLKTKCIKPEFSAGMVHSHNEWVWIRVYSLNPLENYIKVSNLDDHIYEIYARKESSTKKKNDYIYKDGEYVTRSYSHNEFICEQLILNSLKNEDSLIFCSDLPLFISNRASFISNYTKFMYCYRNECADFEVSSYNDYESFNTILSTALTIFENKNLTIMPDKTHNPLIRYTGDNPQRELAKIEKGKIYNAHGSRAEISMDGSSDYGTLSHFIEIVSTLKANDQSYINNII